MIAITEVTREVTREAIPAEVTRKTPPTLTAPAPTITADDGESLATDDGESPTTPQYADTDEEEAGSPHPPDSYDSWTFGHGLLDFLADEDLLA